MATDDPNTFPTLNDQTRISNYDHYDKLYRGEHYKAFALKAKKGFPEHYAKLRYIVGNFAGLSSRILADMLFGEPLVFDVKDPDTQLWLDALIDDTHLIEQCYESALANSRRGDDVFRIRIEADEDDQGQEICIEQMSAANYFPTFQRESGRLESAEDVLAWIIPDGDKYYLHKEIHTPGQIRNEVSTYNPDTKKIISPLTDEKMKSQFNLDPIVDTKVDESLVFHIPNVRDGEDFFGSSDYSDLESLFFALNNRITKVDNILDKHSDPILAVPPGVLDESGNVRKERMGLFEVDNSKQGFNKPEYITWNANLESAFKQVDKLTDMLFMFSDVSPATLGVEKSGGQAESGRALRYKLLRTIAKRNRKKLYYDLAIKQMLKTAMDLGIAWNIQIDGLSIKKSEKPTIKWGDGVLPDFRELIENEVKRLDAGITTRADSISKLDNMKPEDAQAKVKEIDQEDTILVPSMDKTAKETPPVVKNPIANRSTQVTPTAAQEGK